MPGLFYDSVYRELVIAIQAFTGDFDKTSQHRFHYVHNFIYARASHAYLSPEVSLTFDHVVNKRCIPRTFSLVVGDVEIHSGTG